MRSNEDMEDPPATTTPAATIDIPSSSVRERFATFIEGSRCTFFCMGPSPSMARYVYAVIFLITSILAWIIRDYGSSALSELERMKGCQGASYCLGAEGVLRVSLGCFIFFFIMFLSTTGTKKLEDPRNLWHTEWWPAKILIWMTLLVIPFFISSAFIQLYGKIAHFGAGVFLVIQLISVISFITWLNDCCQSDKFKLEERCHVQVLVLSIASYVASNLGIILMFVWYAPKASCGLNIFFITSTWLILMPLMTIVSKHPKVGVGYLAPGLMSLYIVFLCWCAIRSEPESMICYRKAQTATQQDWLTITSFIFAVLVIVMATFSTGVDSKTFQFKHSQAESEDDVPYGYGFFHFVFAIGSMYFAMLFIGWNGHNTMRKWTIDVGWASTWVRIVNQWLATIVYIWMLVGPLVWKSQWIRAASILFVRDNGEAAAAAST